MNNNNTNIKVSTSSKEREVSKSPSSIFSFGRHIRKPKNELLKNRLSSFIKAQGISEADFYKSLGYSPQVWYDISWGRWDVSQEHKIRIAQALGVDSSIIFQSLKSQNESKSSKDLPPTQDKSSVLFPNDLETKNGNTTNKDIASSTRVNNSYGEASSLRASGRSGNGIGTGEETPASTQDKQVILRHQPIMSNPMYPIDYNLIDKPIVNIIDWCNNHKLKTRFSCSGHEDNPYNKFDYTDIKRFPKVFGENWQELFYYRGYINFFNEEDAESFFSLINEFDNSILKIGLDNASVRFGYTKCMKDEEIEILFNKLYNFILNKESADNGQNN